MKDKKTTDDEQLFNNTMQGVKPLKPSNRVFYKKAPTKTPKKKQEEVNLDVPYIYHAPNVGADERLSYLRSNVDAKLLKSLKQGKLRPELTLDLHGYTMTEAEKALTEFVQHAKMQDIKTVLIIHGKGKQLTTEPPKMKNLVNRYLLSIPEILAFCSAKPKEGGTGAVYVLLGKG